MKRAILLMMVAGVASVTATAQAGSRGGHRTHKVDLKRSQRASFAVTNARSEAVQVFLDGRYGGSVAPGETWRRGLRPGPVAVEVRDADGGVLAQASRRLAPREAAELEVAAAPARLRLDNAAAVTLTVWVGHEVVAELAPGERAQVPVEAGAGWVRATYQQHGRSVALWSERVAFEEGARVPLTFEAPGTTFVSVTQGFDRRARLTIDGAPGPWMAPGETRLVGVPVGTVALGFERQGRVLQARRVFAAPDRDAAWVAGAASPQTDRAARAAPHAVAPQGASGAWVDRARAASDRSIAPAAREDRRRHDGAAADDVEACHRC